MAIYDIGGEYRDIDDLSQIVDVIREKTSPEFAAECEELMVVAERQARMDIEGIQYDLDRISEEWQEMRNTLNEIGSQIRQYIYKLDRKEVPFSRKHLNSVLSDIIRLCDL